MYYTLEERLDYWHKRLENAKSEHEYILCSNKIKDLYDQLGYDPY